jgi:regulator of protease activity HflC (stomatin/prohibitin superfamily)
MGWFIAACITGGIALIVGLISLAVRPNGDVEMEDAKRFGGFATLGLIVMTGVCLLLGSFYSQSSGQAKIITRLGGEVVAADTTMGFGNKAPWDTAHTWDLFTRDISLSEPDADFKPKFENGEITASRIATSVRSGEESGAQVWFEMDVTYDFVTDEDSFDTEEIDYIPADFMHLHKNYRDQDRFTRQIIYPELMKAANTVPSQYTTTQFRGAGSVEAAGKIAEMVNAELAKYGIHIGVASIKNVQFTDAVEASLSQVEEKQQQEEAARADAAAKQVQNEQSIKNARAEAEANRIISESITPELVELRKIEAYKEGTVFVVPDGSTPMINTAK